MRLVFILWLMVVIINGEAKKIHWKYSRGFRHVPIEKVPYIVSIGYDSHKCSGALISQEWVITSSQCLTMNEVYVYPGINENKKFETEPDKKIPVGEIVRYPKHSNEDEDDLFFYDFALLQLNTSVQLSEQVQVIRIETDDWASDETRKCYGYDYYNGELKETEYEISDLSKSCLCLSDEKVICNKIVADDGNKCIGDLGALLVCEGKLSGVLSGGFGAAFCDISDDEKKTTPSEEDEEPEESEEGPEEPEGTDNNTRIAFYNNNSAMRMSRAKACVEDKKDEIMLNIYGRPFAFAGWINDVLYGEDGGNGITPREIKSDAADLQSSYIMLIFLFFRQCFITFNK